MQSSLLNGTKPASSSKVDCAKECPCGVAAIPVPDQWLEVMVTGGFKVWHIIFIIIALTVTIVVVYCCFHRCRIPRTKQEIEADLMRTNLSNKFRDYLQEFPNEQTTFLDALKKVQELEEKLEQDDAMLAADAGARKRLGWLKLKGKGGQDKDAINITVDKESAKPQTEEPTLEPPDETMTILTETIANNSAQLEPLDLQTLPDIPAALSEPRGSRQLRRRRRDKPNLSRSKGAKNQDIQQDVLDQVAQENATTAAPVIAVPPDVVIPVNLPNDTVVVHKPHLSADPSNERRPRHRSKTRKELKKTVARDTSQPTNVAETSPVVSKEGKRARHGTRSTKMKS